MLVFLVVLANPTPKRALEGLIVGDEFRLKRLINEGGMGLIWEAERLDGVRGFAVKLLRADRVNLADARARFLREVKAASRIEHPSVCHVVDFGITEDGTPWYVMPLLIGRSLAESLADDGAFTLTRTLDIADQVLEALSSAHASGVIHRDLKPSNIFLESDKGEDEVVKILDFGISKVDKQQGEDTTFLTPAGEVIGSLHYMSPEQAWGAQEIDGRADVFATATIIYEMLTGQRAFFGTNPVKILWRLFYAPLIPIRGHQPELPSELDQIILKALSRDPAGRYPTVDDFRQALDDLHLT